ncbi:MAG TPA: lysylphosphatidylglycerol synthase transmembrane domain-containing protein [Anaerolineales bacterium]|nr:lysylphosphatidylglycerol synthase transmembrane domain-containing protein [Anaerolineales bacterium]
MPSFLKDAKRWLPGALISIVLIGAILYFVDIPRVLLAITSANYAVLAVATVLAFAWMFLRAVVWRTLLRDRPTYRDTLMSLGEGYLLNNILPFRLGEIGRVYMLSRKSGLPFAEVLPSVFIERAVDIAFTVGIFLASLPFITGTSGAGRIGGIIGILVGLGLLGMYLLARNDRWALDTFHRLSARWPRLQRLGGGILEPFLAGLVVLTDGWVFARFLFYMTLNWLLAIVNYYLIILAFFPQTQITWAMFGLGAAALGGAVPSLPGAVGTFEGAFAGALTLLTGDPSTSLAVALVSRFLNYLTSFTIGGYAFAKDGQSLSAIYHELVNLRTKEKSYDSTV